MSDQVPLTERELQIARKYDLTNKVSQFLDRHLVYPLFEFLGSEYIYDNEVVSKLIFELLKDTNMTSFVKKQFEELYPNQEFPKELLEKENTFKSESERLDKETQETLMILSQKEVQEKLKEDKDFNKTYLETNHGITDEKINALYDYAQLQYNAGDYVMASDLLNNFRLLSTNTEKVISATWGRLACEIISLQWKTALEELLKLREVVGSRTFKDPLVQLNNRTWVIHWCLFPFFNTKSGTDDLCDLFFSTSYLSTIQASCPWILRYLVFAVVSSFSSKNSSVGTFQKRIKELIKVVGQEQYEYNDPLTEFIKALYIDYDFEAANEKLNDASIIIRTDFFLSAGVDSFMDNARYLISEVYCKVHNRIELTHFYKFLNLNEEDGELWIAKLIRDFKINAKIDEGNGTLVMNHHIPSVYQDVISKTQGLNFRSNQILSSISKESEE